MDEYKSNSYKSKAEQAEKKVEKVVTGVVKTKPKSEATKVKDLLISEDAANVKKYILMDVLIPAFKKAISDIVTNGIEMILYGEVGRSGKRPTADRVSYRDYYDSSRDRDRAKPAARYSFSDLTFENRGDAERVLDRMDELIATYGMVSVADMLDTAGIVPNYTDNKYGWTSLRNAKVIRTRDDDYMIDLPRAMPID